jgi:hypothetical protein
MPSGAEIPRMVQIDLRAQAVLRPMRQAVQVTRTRKILIVDETT